MTISSEIRKAGPFEGNGFAAAFPFPFRVLDAADVLVVRADLGANESALVFNTDYTVTLGGDQPGGTVLLAQPLPAGWRLTITSDAPNLQLLDLTNMGGFFPETINTALDRATILIQQLAEMLSRAILVPINSDMTPDELYQELIAIPGEVAALAAQVQEALLEAQAAAAAAQEALDKLKRSFTVSALPPSGGADGDIWFQVTEGA